MIKEVTAGILNVRGRRIAMEAAGPRPGKTPINVPRNTPIKQKRRLNGVRRTENP
jgi:hypothetical protein